MQEQQRPLLPLLQSPKKIFRDATFLPPTLARPRRLEVRKAGTAFLPSRDDAVEPPVELRQKPRRQPLAARPARDVGRALRLVEEPDHLAGPRVSVLLERRLRLPLVMDVAHGVPGDLPQPAECGAK